MGAALVVRRLKFPMREKGERPREPGVWPYPAGYSSSTWRVHQSAAGGQRRLFPRLAAREFARPEGWFLLADEWGCWQDGPVLQGSGDRQPVEIQREMVDGVVEREGVERGADIVDRDAQSAGQSL